MIRILINQYGYHATDLHYCSGAMGVPITFLSEYNPAEFEILGLGNGREHFTPIKDYLNPVMFSKGKRQNGNAINRVLTYVVAVPPSKGTYYMAENIEGYLFAPYARVLIKRK